MSAEQSGKAAEALLAAARGIAGAVTGHVVGLALGHRLRLQAGELYARAAAAHVTPELLARFARVQIAISHGDAAAIRAACLALEADPAPVRDAPPPVLAGDAPERAQAVDVRSVPAVGAAIRQARLARGLTQGHLAACAGVGRRFVSELEAGKASLEFGRILAVCAALELRMTIHAA